MRFHWHLWWLWPFWIKNWANSGSVHTDFSFCHPLWHFKQLQTENPSDHGDPISIIPDQYQAISVDCDTLTEKVGQYTQKCFLICSSFVTFQAILSKTKNQRILLTQYRLYQISTKCYIGWLWHTKETKRNNLLIVHPASSSPASHCGLALQRTFFLHFISPPCIHCMLAVPLHPVE